MQASTRRATIGLGIAVATAQRLHAQVSLSPPAWPSHPVRYIEVIGPGSSSDLASRAWCAAMSEATSQPFVVESRVGAGGTIGNAAIARATPDGHTIGMSGLGQLAAAPALQPGLAYDPGRDFTFICGLLRTPIVFAVANDLPARSVSEFVTLLRREPGTHLYGHGGSGTSGHLAAELFKARAGVELGGVSYRGPGPALMDLMAGRVGMVATLLANILPGVRDGRFRALAVTGPDRSPSLPDVPAIAEFLEGFDLTAWLVVVGPAGIQQTTTQRMRHYAAAALNHPGFLQQVERDGATPWTIEPEFFETYRAAQEAQLASVIRAAGMRAN